METAESTNTATEITDITKKLNKRLDDRWRIAIRGRNLREARWFRNIRMRNGEQWLYITPQGRIERRPLPSPDWPLSYTNKLGQISNDLVASLVGQPVPLNPMPSTGDEDDKGAAEVADLFSAAIEKESEWEEIEETIANWVTDTGNAFVIPYYDYDEKWGVRQMDFMVCPQCQKEWPDGDESIMATGGNCPECSRPPETMQTLEGEIEVSPAAPVPLEPVVKEFPIGKLCSDVKSPFEILFDNRIPFHLKKPWFFARFSMPIEEAKKKWPEYANLVHQGMEQPTPSAATDYREVLAYIGVAQYSVTQEQEQQVQGVVYFEEPCPDYPNGLRIVRLGASVIVEVEDLKTGVMAGPRKGQKFLPLIQFVSDVPCGSAWGRPKSDDLVHMQHRRNIIESALQLTAERTGMPKMMVPEKSLGSQTITGGPQILNYRPFLVGTSAFAKPEYLEASLGNVGPLITLLQMLDDGMERVAGTYFLQGGDAPAGVVAASALALLDERAQRALSPAKRKWARAKRNWMLMCMEIIRFHWTEDRILAVAGRNKQWQIEKFKGADFMGAIDLRIDYEAMFPKSKARESAEIQLITQLGLIDPQNPEMQYEALSSFGLTRLQGSVNEAVSQARREFERFMDEAKNGKPIEQRQLPILLPAIQNSMVHYTEHRRAAQTQEFEVLLAEEPEWAQVWVNHILATLADVVTQQATIGVAPSENGKPSSQQGSLAESATAGGESAPVRKGRDRVAQNRGEQPPPEPPMTGANARR